jgi:hypothetical protein
LLGCLTPTRIVVPENPHHVTARGNRREPIFFEDGDQEVYVDLLCEQLTKARVELWAYCLMPNHVTSSCARRRRRGSPWPSARRIAGGRIS